MPPFIPAGHLLPRAVDAFLPARSSLDLNDDVSTDEVGYSISNTALVIDHGGGVQIAYSSESGHLFQFKADTHSN